MVNERMKLNVVGNSLVLGFALACAFACASTPKASAPPPPLVDDVTRGMQDAKHPTSDLPAFFEQDIPACTSKLAFKRIDAPTPFWMASSETTWEMFDAFVYKKDQLEGLSNADVDALTRPSQPYNPMDRGFGHDGYPAISMSFQNAKAFCEWLSAHSGLRYRLPTEAEWELAARAGAKGDVPDALASRAWFADNSGGKTHPVNEKLPNELGLYDMLGNAGEWCVAPDGSGVMRGGTFQSKPEEATYTARAPATPEWNRRDPQIPKSKWWLIDGGFVGFRVLCESPLKTASTTGGA